MYSKETRRLYKEMYDAVLNKVAAKTKKVKGKGK